MAAPTIAVSPSFLTFVPSQACTVTVTNLQVTQWTTGEGFAVDSSTSAKIDLANGDAANQSMQIVFDPGADPGTGSAQIHINDSIGGNCYVTLYGSAYVAPSVGTIAVSSTGTIDTISYPAPTAGSNPVASVALFVGTAPGAESTTAAATNQGSAAGTFTYPTATSGSNFYIIRATDSNSAFNVSAPSKEVSQAALTTNPTPPPTPTPTTPTTPTPTTPTPTTPTTPTPTTPTTPTPTPQRDGFLNLDSCNDYYQDQTYANLAQHARAFCLQGDPYEATTTVPVDANGCPTTDFSTILSSGLARNDLAGTIDFGFEGQGIPSFPDSPDITFLSQPTYDAPSNTTSCLVNVPPNTGHAVRLQLLATRRTATSPTPVAQTDKNGITSYSDTTGIGNLWFMRPITYGSITPHPRTERYSREFLRMTSGKSVSQVGFRGIRVLNLSPANNYPATVNVLSVAWSSRILPTRLSQTGEGVLNGTSIEDWIGIARAGNQDLWIPLSETWNDQCITNVALACRYGTNGVDPYTGPIGSTVSATNPRPVPGSGPLYPGLAAGNRPYFEYSNEVTFNSKFPQYQRNINAGYNQIQAAAPALTDLNWDGLQATPANQYTIGIRRVGQQIIRIQGLVDAVYPAGLGTGYSIVCSTQKNDLGTLAPIGQYFDNVQATTGRAMNTFCDYFGFDWYAYLNTLVTDGSQTVDQMIGSGINTTMMPSFAPYQAFAAQYGLKLALYEGGVNEVGDFGETPQSILCSADPRFGRLCRQLIDYCFAAGVSVLGFFASTAGAWRFAGPRLDLTHTKYVNTVAALDAWASNPTSGTSTAATVPLSTCTAITLTVPTITATTSSVQVIATMVGTNSPLSTGTWSCTGGLIDQAGNLTIPPLASLPQVIVVRFSSNFYQSSGAFVTGSITVTIPASSVPAPPPLGDPSFEYLDIAASQSPPFLLEPPGSAWTFAATGTGNNSGIGLSVLGGYASPSQLTLPAGGGSNYGFLQGTASMSQVMAGWMLGGTYTLTLFAAQRDNSPFAGTPASTQKILVQVDGATVATITPSGTTYASYTTPTFAVTAGTHTLALVTTSASANDCALIDLVSLALVSTPTPTPTTPTPTDVTLNDDTMEALVAKIWGAPSRTINAFGFNVNLAPGGLDLVIVEPATSATPATGSTPAIAAGSAVNARQAFAQVLAMAAGVVSGSGTDPDNDGTGTYQISTSAGVLRQYGTMLKGARTQTTMVLPT